MTDEKEYEHLKNFKVQIEEIVKCPICQLIPRKIPISCCAKGHIICQDCRESIIRCPLCRGTLFNDNKNSLIGAVVELCSHKCKYSVFGCKFETSFDKITEHEAVCIEKTVICPFASCHREVQLRSYLQHAFAKECAINLGKKLINNF